MIHIVKFERFGEPPEVLRLVEAEGVPPPRAERPGRTGAVVLV